jgi:hypothetical protein
MLIVSESGMELELQRSEIILIFYIAPPELFENIF